MRTSTNRRKFLGRTTGAAASTWAGAGLFAAGASAARGPNDSINLGIIGCGHRSRELLPCFSVPGSRVVAVCDVNSKRLAEVREMAGGERVRAYHDYPSLTNAMIFHEHAVWPYQAAPELIRRKPEPGSEWNDAEKRWDYALRLGRLLRHHFPQLRITLGNSLACSELIAEGLRRGFPEEYADYLGLEVVGRTSLPERQWEGALQGGELMLQTARQFGYHRWKLVPVESTGAAVSSSRFVTKTSAGSTPA